MPRVEMRGRVDGPGANDALGDGGGFIEHFQLVVFGGQRSRGGESGRFGSAAISSFKISIYQ